ncbi:hypothetical protein VNO77_30927 [Canavalia gladiata]|uniref:Uncharacterized protein n=1 Tax=Canavalia gladiata TaxID=3824 RepID=A0AAN9Q1K5_CANGL
MYGSSSGSASGIRSKHKDRICSRLAMDLTPHRLSRSMIIHFLFLVRTNSSICHPDPNPDFQWRLTCSTFTGGDRAKPRVLCACYFFTIAMEFLGTSAPRLECYAL